MDFININKNYSEKDRPRFLTDDEIEAILEHLPLTYSADVYEGQLIRDAIRKDLKSKLMDKKISPFSINNLTNDIVKYYVTSRIAAGHAAGESASENSAATPMQAALNAFHSSGSRSNSGGINGIEELLYMKKNKKHEICSVHYKDKNLTYEEVLDTKKDIIGVTVSELLEDYLYIKEGQNYVKDITIDLFSNLPKKWFHHSDYIKLIDSELPPEDAYVLRIKLSKYQMYIYKVTIQDIIDTFKRELDTPVKFIYGSINDGIIDIFTCSQYVEQKNGSLKLEAAECDEDVSYLTSAAYYQTIIIPSFNTLRIKGVQGITNLVPIVVPVVSIILTDDTIFYLTSSPLSSELLILLDIVGINVRKEGNVYLLKMPDFDNIILKVKKEEYDNLTPVTYLQKIIDEEEEDQPHSLSLLEELKASDLVKTALVTLSAKNMKNNGINKEKLTNLLEILNIKIIKEEDLKLYIDKVSVRSYINKKIEEDDLVKRASELIYSEVSGTNLRGLLALDLVDQERTISNNVHVIADVLGIRAARSYFIKDLYNIMSGFGLHPQHIITIADVFFSKGIPLGAQSLSANKGNDPITKGSIQKPADVFKSSAILGTSHEITGVTSNIIFGKNPRVGTGYMDIGYNSDKNVLINADIYKKFKQQNLLQVIEDKEEEEGQLVSAPLLVGKKVSIKPTTSKTITPVSRFQRKPVDQDKTEKKRGRKK